MNPPALQIADLYAGYGKVEVLHGVTIEVLAGEIVCVIGPNGAGKTTLLKSVFGLTSVTKGNIFVNGESVDRLRTHHRIRRGIAYVPQEASVFPTLTVQENLDVAAYASKRGKSQGTVEEVFGHFPRLRERRTQRAGTLSGGEVRMLATGLGLVSRPGILLLDEPSVGLAPLIVRSLFDHIKQINQTGTAILVVEQNARAGLAIADRAFVMELGRIVMSGTGAELLEDKRIVSAYLGT